MNTAKSAAPRAKPSLIAPIEAAGVSDDWARMIATIMRRDGYEIRGSAQCGLELKRRDHKEWQSLMLPNNGYTFASDADRDAVVARIQREAEAN